MKKKKKTPGRKRKYGKAPVAIKLSLSPDAREALSRVEEGKKSEYVSILILNAPLDIKNHYLAED